MLYHPAMRPKSLCIALALGFLLIPACSSSGDSAPVPLGTTAALQTSQLVVPLAAGDVETLFLANDVLNTDPDRLESLLEETDEILKAGVLYDDAAYRLLILTNRAVVPYLPEKLRFPLALNLPGDVTSMASRGRSIYLGTTRGLIMYADGRSLALNDTTAGAVAAAVHDVAVEPSGVVCGSS